MYSDKISWAICKIIVLFTIVIFHIQCDRLTVHTKHLEYFLLMLGVEGAIISSNPRSNQTAVSRKAGLTTAAGRGRRYRRVQPEARYICFEVKTLLKCGLRSKAEAE